ncbi:MAG: CPBP family intramembrane metalloprotease [Verrucomicrobia bacterium]|nr:CPBP family intramembrane metalloprotease [Verrucomicrobiota bacterium]
MEQTYLDALHVIFFFGLLGVLLIWVAKARGFFTLPPLPPQARIQLPFRCVAIVFAIYFSMVLLAAPLLVKVAAYLYHWIFPTRSPPLGLLGIIQLLNLSGIFALLYFYTRGDEPSLFRRIWKDRTRSKQSFWVDGSLGLVTWFLAFPCVIVIGEIADTLVYAFYGIVQYEQVAVRYLKVALSSTPMLISALISILIAAPFLEEFLFRGCLQTYFKRFMRPASAIGVTSLCFALFHFSLSQGIGNIPLIASLFTFALFLGFIYERQSSLFASISLHMTFNAISTLRIFLLPE